MPTPAANSNVPAKEATPLMAKLALGCSIFAFILPLGIAAIAMAQMAGKTAAPDSGEPRRSNAARAALWIAYIQVSLVVVALAMGWGVLHEMIEGYRHDAMVQRLLRAHDEMQPLDAKDAHEAEGTAQAILTQFIAMEDHARRRSNGSYVCSLDDLETAGLEGQTEAEKTAFALRAYESPYVYEINNCNPGSGAIPSNSYTLVAVPRIPRMPEGSAILCSDQTGRIRQIKGRTSLDCVSGPAASE